MVLVLCWEVHTHNIPVVLKSNILFPKSIVDCDMFMHMTGGGISHVQMCQYDLTKNPYKPLHSPISIDNLTFTELENDDDDASDHGEQVPELDFDDDNVKDALWLLQNEDIKDNNDSD